MKVIIDGNTHADNDSDDSFYRFLYDTLDCPGWCGYNPNALWDTLTGVIDAKDVEFEWINFSTSLTKFGDHVHVLYKVFTDAEKRGSIKGIKKFDGAP